jgi:hypothetical protein
MRYFILVTLLLILLSCEKTETDYRDVFTGEYNFTIEKISRTLASGPPFIEFTINNDTIFYLGSVKKDTSAPNNFRIDWGNDTIPLEGGGDLDQSCTIMSIDEAGNLGCAVNPDAFWGPAYIHNDTIRFTFYCSMGMSHMLWVKWGVIGLRKLD